MDKLPEEMLLEIMEYLKYSDLKCFRLVCKKFYEASLTFRIVNRDNFIYGVKTISLSPKLNFDDCMTILSTTERNFYHFHFFDTKITVDFREFVEKRAEDILSLKFERCEIMYNPISFCESINECTELISLKLHVISCPLVWNRAATISLAALETMDVSRIPDDMFNALMDTNVKNLHLCVDYHHLNDVISTRGRLEDLKCVDLSGYCNDARLMNIADNLNLMTICINYSGVTDEGFKYFLEKQRKLQTVVIRDCAYMTDESFVAIADNLKDLKELTIENDADDIKCSFDTLNQIINLTPVRRLDCSAFIENSGLATTVGDGTVTKCLRQLCMDYVQSETYVTYIAENFRSLTELKLTESDGVTSETLRLICQNLKKLKKLILSDCNAINAFGDDVPQLTFSANFKNLEELDLSWSGWLSDSTLETCFKSSSLRILNLSHCKKLTAKSFVAMPKNFPCLEYLNIVGPKVDNDVLLSTVSLMKRLRKLYIQVSEPTTNDLLNLLYEHSDSLHRVDFGRAPTNGCFIRSLESKTFVRTRGDTILFSIQTKF